MRKWNIKFKIRSPPLKIKQNKKKTSVWVRHGISKNMKHKAKVTQEPMQISYDFSNQSINGKKKIS